MSVSDNYSPSYIVRQTHDILHLDAKLSIVSSDWDITYSSQWNTYSRSLIPVPMICCVLGIIAIMILQIVLCARACCKSCRCLPRITASGPFISEDVIRAATNPRFNVLFWSFIIFALLVVLTDQMMLFGNRYLTEGLNTSKDAVNFVYDLTTSLVTQGGYLLNNGTLLETHLNQADADGCSMAGTLADNVHLYTDEINDYLSYVDPIPGRCTDATDALDEWGLYKNAALFLIYGITLLLIVFYGAGVFLKNRCSLQTSMSFTMMFMYLFFILVGVEMVILVSDICSFPW
jgi:hypothetical protein